MSEERKLTRRAALAAGAAGAAGTGIGLGIALSSEKEEPKLSTQLTARLAREVPAENPLHNTWNRAHEIRVAVSPQQMAPPILLQAGVRALTVGALHDGNLLCFRLVWDDADRDDLDGIARFHDAVAVQLPATAATTPPPITMGATGRPVHVLQWRATWQRDVEGRGRTGLYQLYPRAIRDLTPEKLLGAEAAVDYYAGRAVGNPLSALERTSPVEEIVAEGFGTATHLKQQRARGGGVWEDGRWHVTIGVPMARAEAGDPIRPGSTWPVAFAVWLGSRDNRGGRKHFANWVSLTLEAA